MNIYIRLEVRARELEGRLLLALVAAERGHDVLLGELRPLLNHRIWLPAGLYHDKSLTPAPRRLALHGRLRAAGFVITSQDEEHGLLQPDYGPFATQRFSSTSLTNAAAVLAWGPRDGDALAAAHPGHAARIHVTGSPRADLWRPELAAFHTVAPPDGPDTSGPYVLYASNVMVTNRNPFWVALRAQRPSYFHGDDDPTEFAHYRSYSEEFAYLPHAVRSIRKLVTAIPGLRVVVRPHPTEAEGAWEDLLGPIEGVTVTRRGAIGPWIRGAVCVVHNGSTSGLEAAVSGTPIVPLVPDGWRSELLTNRLGPIARDADEVVTRVQALLQDGGVRDPAVANARTHASTVLAATEGPLAADRIVDVWESLPGPVGARRPPRVRDLALGRWHHLAGHVRSRARQGRTAPTPFETAHKFPPLGRHDLASLVERFKTSMGRFGDVEVERWGPRMVRVRPADRRS